MVFTNDYQPAGIKNRFAWLTPAFTAFLSDCRAARGVMVLKQARVIKNMNVDVGASGFRLRFVRAMLFLAIALSVYAQALSYEEAAVKAKPYLDSSLAPLPKQFYIRSDSYYIYSPSIYSPKRLFIAISDRSGEVEADKLSLVSVGNVAYNYGVLSEYVRRNKISFADMETTVKQTMQAADRNVNTLSALSSRTQESYPALSFDSVDSKAIALQSAASDLDSIVSDGVGLEKQFDSDYSDTSLQGVITYYQTVFAKAGDFISAYDEYNNVISQKQTEVFKSSIPAPDNENIVKNLENMRLKIDLFENLRYLQPSDGLKKLLAAREKWVNDSIASFSYKKLTIDVKSQVDGLRPSITSVFDGETYLAQCGLQDQVDSIKSKWSDVQFLYDRGRASDFDRLPAKLKVISSEYDALNAKYQACTNPHRAPVQPPDSGGGGANYLPVLLIVVLAAAGYFVYRYKQSQEESYQ